MASANLVKIIREALGISMLEAKEMLEQQGANERTLTKRELFAAMAMQSLVRVFCEMSHTHDARAAEQAVIYADALIAELEKGK